MKLTIGYEKYGHYITNLSAKLVEKEAILDALNYSTRFEQIKEIVVIFLVQEDMSYR